MDLRPALICFHNIISNVNIIENEFVYPLPVYSAKERRQEQGKNYTPVSNDGTNVIDGIADSYQHRKRQKQAEINEDRRLFLIVSFAGEEKKNDEQ